jgi:hypothetical protein
MRRMGGIGSLVPRLPPCSQRRPAHDPRRSDRPGMIVFALSEACARPPRRSRPGQFLTSLPDPHRALCHSARSATCSGRAPVKRGRITR